MRFDSYHPAINFIFFTAVIAATVSFDHPAFVVLSWLCAFIYSVALEGKRALWLDLAMVPLMALFAGYYAFYNHFGVTNLSVNFIGNAWTLESLIYGGVIAVKAAGVCMWMICVHSVVSSDKVIYLLGRVSPRLSLLLSLILRLVPRVRRRCSRVEEARRCVGRSIRQGNPLRRAVNLLREISIVITWTLEDLEGSSESMKSRGVALRGRTAYSIYRFDNRDRSFVIALFAGFTVMTMGVLLDQTKTLYAPEILINPVSPLSFLFYAVYAVTCLLPFFLQLFGERRFRRLMEKNTKQSYIPETTETENTPLRRQSTGY